MSAPKITIAGLLASGNQIIALAQLGGAIVSAGVGVFEQVKAILRKEGYEHDTSELDELLADAERRRQLAAREKNAQA